MAVGVMLAIVAGFCCLTFTHGANVVDVCQSLATAVQPVKTFFANTFTAEATSLDETALNQICSGEDDIETLKTECQDKEVVSDFENYSHVRTYFCSTAGRIALDDLHLSECLRNGYTDLFPRMGECAKLYEELGNVEGQYCNALKGWFECARERVAQDCDQAYANVTMYTYISFTVPLGPEAMMPCRDVE